MKTYFSGILIIFILFIFSISCEKNKELTREEILTLHTWIESGLYYEPAIEIVVDTVNDITVSYNDVYDLQYECDKDDIYKFNANGTFSFEEGDNICSGSPASGLIYSGTWLFSDNGQYLILSVSGLGQAQYYIEELVENSLKLQYQIQDTAQVVYTVTESYKYK